MQLNLQPKIFQKKRGRQEGRKERRKEGEKNFPSPDGFTDKFFHILKGKIISVLHTFIQKMKM